MLRRTISPIWKSAIILSARRRFFAADGVSLIARGIREGALLDMANFEFIAITQMLTVAMAVLCIVLALRHTSRTPLTTYFSLFAVAMLCAALGGLYGAKLGPIAPIIAIGGFAGCGWSWLYARALFQPKPTYEIWPLAIVAAIIAPEILAQVLIIGGVNSAGFVGPFWRIADNMQGLASSTVLVLALVEAVRGYNRSLPQRERRFRQIFIACYASLVAVAVLWVSQSAAGTLAAEWKDGVQTSCAFAAMAMAGLSVKYRFTHPLRIQSPGSSAPNRLQHRPIVPNAEASALANRIVDLFETREVFKTPNLKVADLARELQEPDYKISRCIVGAMGFANFNRLANFYRINCAKRILSDPSFDDQSILLIGMDCGFGSIGPFNRAFKEATGLTPRAFRNTRTTPGNSQDYMHCDDNDKAALAIPR